MNKNDLVKAMAAKAGMTNVDAKKALDAFIEVTKETVKAGDEISLVGFGSFKVIERSARTGINPQTKAKVEIPAKKVVKFKAGAGLAL